jgi:integrase
MAGLALHPRTVGHAHAVLRAALNQAVKDRIIDFNPVLAADPPRVPGSTFTVWEAAQQRAFLAHVADDPLEALYRLALTTGMRQGELLGLRWRDVNFDAGTLTINQVLVRTGRRYDFPDPKTAQSRRTIPLAARTIASLKRRKREQAEHRIEQAKGWMDRDLVFTLDGGEPLPNWWVTGEFQRRTSEAGLPKARFHDLRHMAASQLIESGADLAVVREILGHSTITTTVNIYGHLTERHKRAAIDRLSEALG